MRTYHQRTEPSMSDDERSRLMVDLRRRGWTYKGIGAAVGMSANGVMQALRRVTEPGRYYARLEEEVLPEEVEDDW